MSNIMCKQQQMVEDRSLASDVGTALVRKVTGPHLRQSGSLSCWVWEGSAGAMYSVQMYVLCRCMCRLNQLKSCCH